jgi:multisubunit Na+/H+ antiporter MnhB subunit
MKVDRTGLGVRFVCAGLALVLAGVLVGVVLGLPEGPAGLSQEVDRALPESGVSNPVTAVLLNFRSLDTWLEVGVLLLGLLGVLVLVRSTEVSLPARIPPVGPLLAWSVAFLFPVALVVAGYLLWRGTFAAGGAFQAGAVLAAALILLRLAGRSPLARLRGILARGAYVIGFLGFLVVAAGTMLAGRVMLQYPVGWETVLIVLIESAVAVGIGLTLALLYLVSEVEDTPEERGGAP